MHTLLISLTDAPVPIFANHTYLQGKILPHEVNHSGVHEDVNKIA